MTDQAAYRRYTAEAERLLKLSPADIQGAQAWATLALAAAQERVQPADRPTGDQPDRIKDGDGDEWTRLPNGLYACTTADDTEDLAAIARKYNGYTVVT